MEKYGVNEEYDYVHNSILSTMLRKDNNSKNSYNINMDLFFENYDDGSGLFVDDKESLDLSKEMFHLYK